MPRWRHGCLTAVKAAAGQLDALFHKQGNVINAGVLQLTGSNTYTGGTTISAGTLQLGNANALGVATEFNDKWINRNNLNTDGTAAQQPAQANGPGAGAPVPNPNYLSDDVQYFPPGGQFPSGGGSTLSVGAAIGSEGEATIVRRSASRSGAPQCARFDRFPEQRAHRRSR